MPEDCCKTEVQNKPKAENNIDIKGKAEITSVAQYWLDVQCSDTYTNSRFSVLQLATKTLGIEVEPLLLILRKCNLPKSLQSALDRPLT